jgi:hypothetical protein
VPTYLVLRASSNGVPQDGQKGTAEIYLGTHPDAASAIAAAGPKFGVTPGTFMWIVDSATLVRYVAAISASVG